MKLSVIIVEYHCVDVVLACVRSLHKHLGQFDWECIVVSNSEYAQEEQDRIAAKLTGARFVSNDRNRGYAGGVNRGFKESTAPFVLILNPDCVLVDNNVGNLLQEMRADSGIAVIGPKVVDGRDAIQPSCRRFPKPWTFLLVRSVLRKLPGASRERRRYLMEDFAHDTACDVDWVSGGAMLVRKTSVEAVGPMDERFFLYMEDVDWCRRFRNAGWRIRYVPSCTIRHDAQHDSLQGGFAALFKPHLRYHLVSTVKYFLKSA